LGELISECGSTNIDSLWEVETLNKTLSYSSLFPVLMTHQLYILRRWVRFQVCLCVCLCVCVCERERDREREKRECCGQTEIYEPILSLFLVQIMMRTLEKHCLVNNHSGSGFVKLFTLII
jgi:hypothetical protein